MIQKTTMKKKLKSQGIKGVTKTCVVLRRAFHLARYSNYSVTFQLERNVYFTPVCKLV